MKKLKRGFWAGLLAFVIARITHLVITACIGLQIGLMSGGELSDTAWTIIAVIDSPFLGIIYLWFVGRWIYNNITLPKEQ